MGRLEEIRENQESKTEELEQKTEETKEKIEELDKKIEALEKAIAACSEDDDARAALERGLSERQQEKQEEKKKAEDLESEVEKLQEELFDPSEINSKTTHSRITIINAEQFEILTYYDKMYLKSMINLEISTEELRRRLTEFLYSIEGRKEYIKRKQKLVSIKI